MDCPKAKRTEVMVTCPSDDALVEILSRLRAKPLFRFKCVSKAWRDLITERLRCREFPQTLEPEGFFIGEMDVNYGDFVGLLGRPVPLVDPSFSFLTKNLPKSEKIVLLGSCNGLVLFGHRRVSDIFETDSLGYIVCNPATEQWVAVPSSFSTKREDGGDESNANDGPVGGAYYLQTYLIFDPAVSPHFQLVQFWLFDGLGDLAEVHTFSSVTGEWRRREGVEGQAWSQWGSDCALWVTSEACPFKGMLHVSIIRDFQARMEMHRMIVAVDGEGKPFRTMHWPDNRGSIVFVGQSQGHLHCVSEHSDFERKMTEFSIWVLEGYDEEKWVLRDTVSIYKLLQSVSEHFYPRCDVIAIHPDRGLVFFNVKWVWKLISYDMDTKEVRALCTLRQYYSWYITPYVPYFAESAALAKNY
ncbi:hypothetical protein BS78_02G060400 [Paspalum vaginatum]|nr:hypothetical protein BS78_02G060400 [Paspalum vaginatum]